MLNRYAHVASALFIMLTLMASCGHRHEADVMLGQADSLMVAQPDSAYRLLSEADSLQRHWRKADRMRYVIALAKAMNKADVPLTTVSGLTEAVGYFDGHGSANERMRAHYLLGCAFRDMGEAPLAVKCFYEAIDCADVHSQDCDYITLSHVYGQMGEIFTAQRLTHMQIEAYKKYSLYAQKAGNTYEYIRGIECLVQPYYQLNDTAKVFEVTEQARRLYLQHGMKQEAARVYPTAITMALNGELWKKAYGMMHIYETLSGLFDRQGNISKGHELYYQSQGRYHLGLHHPDSAAFYFRKLVSANYRLEGYRGLLQTFIQLHNTDSVIHYSRLYERALDLFVRNMETEATQHAAALYNYARVEEIAKAKSSEARRDRRIIYAGIVGIGMGAFGLLLRGKKRRKERKRLQDAYAATQQDLTAAQHELSYLRQALPQQEEEARQFLTAKEQRIAELEAAITNYRTQLGILDVAQREECLKNNDIVKHLRTIGQPHFVEDKNGRRRLLSPRTASEREFDTLRKLFKKYHLSFVLLLDSTPALTRLEYKVCLLSRVDFMTKEMSTLLGSSDQAVSNARTSIARKLFQLSKASELNSKLKEV